MPGLARREAVAILVLAPAVASALWLLGSVLSPGDQAFQLLSDRLQAAGPAPIAPVQPAQPMPVDLLSRPLFTSAAPTTVSSAATLRLQGTVTSPHRSAALIAIGDKPPVWLTVGEMRDGVTLRRVAPGSVLVETFGGDKNLTLGGKGAPSGPVIPPP